MDISDDEVNIKMKTMTTTTMTTTTMTGKTILLKMRQGTDVATMKK